MYAEIVSWSETWAIFIPLTFFWFKRSNDKKLIHIKNYLLIALVLNTGAGLIWEYNKDVRVILQQLSISENFARNNFLYNLHSIIRVVFFLFFFNGMFKYASWLKTTWSIPLFLVFALFIFSKDGAFFIISSKLFALEGILLLFYCVSLFIERLKEEELSLDFDAPLVVTTGLTIYESINFFIFLFFDTLLKMESKFALSLWYVHNFSFIIFCFFIAYAFYGKQKKDEIKGKQVAW